ncbi:hypothetical protein KM043_012622 [Ampulex compressa]|nr:hypothetical protein KM043_012622 [Ampulex compressa]
MRDDSSSSRPRALRPEQGSSGYWNELDGSGSKMYERCNVRMREYIAFGMHNVSVGQGRSQRRGGGPSVEEDDGGECLWSKFPEYFSPSRMGYVSGAEVYRDGVREKLRMTYVGTNVRDYLFMPGPCRVSPRLLTYVMSGRLKIQTFGNF